MSIQIIRTKLREPLVLYPCPHCGVKLKNRLRRAGTEEPCPQCGRDHRVPGETDRKAERKREANLQKMKQQKEAETKAMQRHALEAMGIDATNSAPPKTRAKTRQTPTGNTEHRPPKGPATPQASRRGSKRFHIAGVDKATGQESEMVLEASDKKLAGAKARAQGMEIARIRPADAKGRPKRGTHPVAWVLFVLVMIPVAWCLFATAGRMLLYNVSPTYRAEIAAENQQKVEENTRANWEPQPKVVLDAQRTAAAWRSVKSWRGSGNKTTETFRISSKPWRIDWRAHDGTPDMSHLSIWVREAETGDRVSLVANSTGDGSDVSYVHDGPGEYYLDIQGTNTAWQVAVESR